MWSLIGPDGQTQSDFRFDERGRLVEDETAATAIAIALDHHLGAWWADPAHGSRFAQLMSGTPSPDMQADVESAVREALAPLERDGRIKDLLITATVDGTRAHVCVRALDLGRGAFVTVEASRP